MITLTLIWNIPRRIILDIGQGCYWGLKVLDPISIIKAKF